ncbi:MAG: N-acetyltransferase family protein [Paraburkholderia tropica]|uniref:Phosphinothricin acetyltransferase n=1 Tax=Paraburkholderia tropica TaxID=92647 RepID=A0ABX5MSC6_9BURK|nr:GNAT family N-acetyltransferase [Paraburkholderia tropica]MDE1140246.1 GNAT family N-acetyltransferase [Paraburkholderia tropica]PXX18174.1 phosphinothricin acetyltransferase [Paraburkholderia tropica]PZW86156.1 phosphinothricin acetyltransferase [Paraburkholderia tropica]
MNTESPRDSVKFIECTEAEHAGTILEILNDAIVNSTALYDYKPRAPEAMHTWFEVKRANGFPVVGAVDEAGTLLGFASWGAFRPFPANKYTVEHSVYVHRDSRGLGLGERLLRELIRRAQEKELHVLVGCIDATNAASIALHTRLGFTHSGTIKEVGFKFGRWLDAAFYQLNLATPAQPVDG